MEEIKDCYYIHLYNRLINFLALCQDYDCKDFEDVKQQMIDDLKSLMQDKATFESLADALRIGREEKARLRKRIGDNHGL